MVFTDLIFVRGIGVASFAGLDRIGSTLHGDPDTQRPADLKPGGCLFDLVLGGGSDFCPGRRLGLLGAVRPDPRRRLSERKAARRL